MWDRERGCRMRRKIKDKHCSERLCGSQLDTTCGLAQTLRSPPHLCRPSPLCFCFSRLNTCYSSWELLSICWSWFACQQRARAVPGNSFPKKLLCPWQWLPLPQLPFPCGFGWNCDFAENQTLSWPKTPIIPATARKRQVHELRLRYQTQL